MLVGDKVTLEYKMNPGEVLRYRTEVHSEQTIREEDAAEQSARSLLTMAMVQEVKEVDTRGLSTVDVTITDGKILQGEEERPLPSVGQTINLVMKKSGEIVRTNVEFPFSQPAFPERPLKVGDHWTGKSDMDLPLTDAEGNRIGSKRVSLNYDYRLEGFENVEGYRCAVIRVECPRTAFPLQEGIEQTIRAKGRTYFAPHEGRLVKSRVETLTKITAPGAEVRTHIKVKVDLAESPPPPPPDYGTAPPDEQYIIGA